MHGLTFETSIWLLAGSTRFEDEHSIWTPTANRRRFRQRPFFSSVSTLWLSNGRAVRFHLLQRAQFTLTHLLLATYLHKCKTRKQSNESAIFANCFQLTFLIDNFPHLAFSTDLQSLSASCFMHLKTETSPERTTHKTPVHMQPRDFFQTPLLHEIFHLAPKGFPHDC